MEFEIKVYPDPVLRKKAKPVEIIDEKVVKTLKAMLDMMHHYRGIGLAAEQIGLLKQLVVVDLMPDGKSAPIMLINPEIIASEGIYEEHEEGCLSVPGYYDVVKDRKKAIKVRYLYINGNDRILETDDFLSVVLQHEIDHLNGTLFIDRLSPVRKSIFRKEWRKLQSKREEEQ